MGSYIKIGDFLFIHSFFIVLFLFIKVFFPNSQLFKLSCASKSPVKMQILIR